MATPSRRARSHVVLTPWGMLHSHPTVVSLLWDAGFPASTHMTVDPTIVVAVVSGLLCFGGLSYCRHGSPALLCVVVDPASTVMFFGRGTSHGGE